MRCRRVLPLDTQPQEGHLCQRPLRVNLDAYRARPMRRYTELLVACAPGAASIGLHALGLAVSRVDVDGTDAAFSLRPQLLEPADSSEWHACGSARSFHPENTPL